jgi:hypothetical protein
MNSLTHLLLGKILSFSVLSLNKFFCFQNVFSDKGKTRPKKKKKHFSCQFFPIKLKPFEAKTMDMNDLRPLFTFK